MESLYEVLGVEKNASAETIKTAYRRAAKKLHPDRQNGTEDAAKMAELNAAYAVLSDPEKRARYDQTGQVNVGKTRDDEVREVFIMALQSVIDDDGNIVSNLSRTLTNAIVEGQKAIEKNKKLISKLSKRLSMVHAPKNNTLLIEVLQGRIDEGVAAVDKAMQSLTILVDAKSLLFGYTSDEEEAAQRQDDDPLSSLLEILSRNPKRTRA